MSDERLVTGCFFSLAGSGKEIIALYQHRRQNVARPSRTRVCVEKVQTDDCYLKLGGRDRAIVSCISPPPKHTAERLCSPRKTSAQCARLPPPSSFRRALLRERIKRLFCFSWTPRWSSSSPRRVHRDVCPLAVSATSSPGCCCGEGSPRPDSVFVLPLPNAGRFRTSTAHVRVRISAGLPTIFHRSSTRSLTFSTALSSTSSSSSFSLGEIRTS